MKKLALISVLSVTGVILLILTVFVIYSVTGTRKIDLEPGVIFISLREYKREFGVYPSGDSHAICQALSGHNSKGMGFLDFGRTSPDGDFLDPWGTPFKIYFSGNEPLIRSAGPNKRFDPSTNMLGADDYFGN